MTDHEHSINRSGRESDDDEGESEDGEELSEAEKRRELRKSPIGRAILDYDRRRRGRR